MTKCSCGRVIMPERVAAGYKLCRGCGQSAALKEAGDKAKRAIIPYNKGPVMYGSSSEKEFRKMLRDSGKKTSQVNEEEIELIRYTRPMDEGNKRLPLLKRKAIKFYMRQGERVIVYEGDKIPQDVTAYPLFLEKKNEN